MFVCITVPYQIWELSSNSRQIKVSTGCGTIATKVGLSLSKRGGGTVCIMVNTYIKVKICVGVNIYIGVVFYNGVNTYVGLVLYIGVNIYVRVVLYMGVNINIDFILLAPSPSALFLMLQLALTLPNPTY